MSSAEPVPPRVPLRRLFGFFAQLNRLQLLALTLVTIALAAVTPATVWLTQRATDSVVRAAEHKAGLGPVLLVVLALAFALFGGELIGRLGAYVGQLVELNLTAQLRLLIATKVSRLELQQLQDAEVHDRLERSKDDIEWRPGQLIGVIGSLVVSVVGLAAAIAIVMSWDPLVGILIAVAAFPPMIAEAVMAREEWLLEHQRTQLERQSDYYFRLLSTPASVAELKSHRAQPQLLGAFEKVIKALLGLDLRQSRRHLWLSLIVSVLALVIMMAAVVVAVQSVLAGGTVGQFAGYLVALTAARNSVDAAGRGVSDFYENKLYLDEVVRFLDLPDTLIAGGTLPVARPNRGGLEFRDLDFRYPGREESTLHKVSFTVEPGQVVGVVGANGAGKSTLIKLVNRLYAAPPGSLWWDGRPIEDYDLDQLRGAISVVMQDFQRYEMTAAENLTIACGERWGDRELARTVAERARADALIDSLPGELDQQLGELFDGARPLSGGQWQLLAIARAMANQPELLILDEPTSAFDAHTEARLFEDLSRLVEGTSCLLVSHRFSTLRMADKIVVLDQGRVVEQGSHRDLLARGGTYAEMYRLQAAGYQSIDPEDSQQG